MRENILAKLRSSRAKLPDPVTAAPDVYLPVARIDGSDPAALLSRFRAEVEKLTGIVHDVPDYAAVCATVLHIIGAQSSIESSPDRSTDSSTDSSTDRGALAWEHIGDPALTSALHAALHAARIEILTPHARGADRSAALAEASKMRVGITGAHAAIAATGTLVLRTGVGQGRIPSLLPMVHIALIAKSVLVPRLEDYLAADGRAAFTETASTVFITGPSRTADIEMQVIRGVHGPGVVHYVFYDEPH